MKKCIWIFFLLALFLNVKGDYSPLYIKHITNLRYLEKQLLLNINKKVVWVVGFHICFCCYSFFFNSIKNIYESNGISLKWLISQFRETDNECTSLTHFYRYSSALMLVKNTGHIANAVKLETINSGKLPSTWSTIMRNSLFYFISTSKNTNH